MKIIYAFVAAISMLCISCHEDEKAAGLRSYIVSESNFHANIAVYDYPAKKLTPDFYDPGTANGQYVRSANKNGGFIYINTSYPPTLKKIDLNSGDELQSIRSWAESGTAIAFHGKDVILFNVSLDGTPEDYFSCIKIYDENLLLKDSIAYPGANEIRNMLVMKDRLFLNRSGYAGGYIEVFDLQNHDFIEPIESGFCWNLIPFDDNNLLAILGGSYTTIDVKTLATSDPVTAYIENSPVALDRANNKLYWLRPNAQPALTPYTLSSINLTTGESTLLQEGRIDDSKSMTGPLVYDEKSKLILSGPGVKTFSTKGELLDKIETTSETKYIFVD